MHKIHVQELACIKTSGVIIKINYYYNYYKIVIIKM